MSGDASRPSPFRYHLELTPAQLKLTHTALRSLLDEAGRDEPEIHRVICEVLDKLPDDRAIGAIRLDDELAQRPARIETELDPPPPRLGGPGDEPPDSVA